MKTERLKNVIFIVSLIVFLLQVTGYLAPAWFVKEIVVKPDAKGMRADGRRFHLPYFREDADETMDRLDQRQSIDGKVGGGGRECFENTKNGHPEPDRQADSNAEPSNPPDRDEMPDTFLNAKPEQGSPPNGRTELGAPPNVNPEPVSPLNNNPQPGFSPNVHLMSPTPTATSNWENEKDKREKRTNMARLEDGTQLLYLMAGFWYSRACVTTRGPYNDDDAGMQWCTMYTRLDNKTLEEKRSMFELRLEATIGVVMSALSLLIASTARGSHRHHGKRAISSLTTMFISGAVMAIPVVHIILQHVQIHNQVVRTRKWMKLTKELYVQHDLFDHYSVILCGAASVISVLFAVILTLVSCRSSSKSDSWYNLKQPPLEEKENKYELPVNWVHNSKITVPQVAEIKDETRDDSESGYSEVNDACTMPGNNAGSIDNDDGHIEFDSSEMKTFDM